MSLTLIGLSGIFLLLLLMFCLAMPVAFAMGIVGLIGFSVVVSFSAGLNMIGSIAWTTFSQYGLTVIPMFIFMGQIAFHSGVNEKLYAAAYRWTGQIRGGLAMATILACSAFSAICGSNAATAATMSTVALPEMNRFSYHPKLSCGTVAAGSTLGVVIPPSVVLIVIGLSTEQSITKLFYGGVGAGVLLTVLMMLTVVWVCRLHPDWGPKGPVFSWREKIRSLSGAVEMAVLFLLVMLGLSFGLFTPSEAGAVGSVLAVGIGIFQGELGWKGIVAASFDTLKVTCMVVMIITGAVIFGRFLAVTRIPFDVAGWVVTLPLPKAAILAVIFLIYIIGGMVMDALALLMVTISIFFPVAMQLGYDPIWFSVVVTVITTLGAITPPVGATAFVVAGMTPGVSLEEVFHGVAYFVSAYLLCVVLLMLCPDMVLFLPTVMGR